MYDFSHALRELNVMVASNEPLQLDPGRLRAMLENYSIDGHPVFDRSNPIHRARLEEIMATVDPSALDKNGPKERWKPAKVLSPAHKTCRSSRTTTWVRNGNKSPSGHFHAGSLDISQSVEPMIVTHRGAANARVSLGHLKGKISILAPARSG